MILLASRSPQRRALLATLGVPFRVVPSAFEEHTAGIAPMDLVLANAVGKARDVADRLGVPADGAVLGADTEVIADGTALGKPADADDARRMLLGLAGRDHEVATAVALITPGGEETAVSVAHVTMRPADESAIDWYLGTGEWHDRAGGYAVQGAGAALVTTLSGDYSTVVGLPVAVVADLLVRNGLGPWASSADGSG